MPPKHPSCAICTSKIPLSSIRTDAEAQHPRFGQHRPGQQTISCSGCGRLLHTACVDEAGTTIGGHHLWFSNMMMRASLAPTLRSHYLENQVQVSCWSSC